MRDQVRRLYNAGFDRFYGISTFESPLTRTGLSSAFCDGLKYVPIDYLALKYLLAPIAFGPQDVFIDIGCGLGRAVLMAGRRPIRRAVGIEYDPRLVEKARHNVRHLRGARTTMEIRHEDATQAEYDAGTIFWMYNPFGEATMGRVLDLLRHSLDTVPRRVRIAYAHPALAPLLDAQPWLRRTGERHFPGTGQNGRAIYWELVASKLPQTFRAHDR